MVRDVLVEVRQHEQQVEHTLALAGIGFADFLFEVCHDGESVRKQPFEIAGSQRTPFAAANEGVVRAHERLVEEMIQTELFGRECSRNRLLAGGPSAASEDRSAHGTPQNLGDTIPEASGAEPITISSLVWEYPNRAVSNVLQRRTLHRSTPSRFTSGRAGHFRYNAFSRFAVDEIIENISRMRRSG